MILASGKKTFCFNAFRNVFETSLKMCLSVESLFLFIYLFYLNHCLTSCFTHNNYWDSLSSCSGSCFLFLVSLFLSLFFVPPHSSPHSSSSFSITGKDYTFRALCPRTIHPGLLSARSPTSHMGSHGWGQSYDFIKKHRLERQSRTYASHIQPCSYSYCTFPTNFRSRSSYKESADSCVGRHE